jgi:tRNA G18 (ribose-2'-O)-methylase SpoU
MNRIIDKLPPLVLVLDRLRSAHNTGNIFRIAEALEAGIAACGYTPFPPHPKLEKTAMGTDLTVPCVHFETAAEAVKILHAAGYTVLAAEPGGPEAWEVETAFPLAVIFGNEALGVSEEALAQADGLISLPMNGSKASINVGNAAAAILYALDARRRGKIGKEL